MMQIKVWYAYSVWLISFISWSSGIADFSDNELLSLNSKLRYSELAGSSSPSNFSNFSDFTRKLWSLSSYKSSWFSCVSSSTAIFSDPILSSTH